MRSFVSAIVPVADEPLKKKICAHLDDLTKPQGSLGRLEEFALQYCLCRGDASARIDTMEMYTFAGDHGITDEKVAPFPKEVTPQMVMNMATGGAAISVLCKHAGIHYKVVDIGVDADFPEHPALIRKKTARGTANFAKGSAMSVQQCEAAMTVGFDIASGSTADLIGIGEMGIGNTSSASALYSLILDIPADRTVGAGTGASGDLLEHKKRVIQQAVDMHKRDWSGTPEDALLRVGGYEIAGMVGMILGAASRRIPVVVDGFISTSAAMVAMGMCPTVQEYLFFSHASAELFHAGYLALKGIRPVLQLDMRLGEGSGAALAMQVIAQAMNCYHEMATFSSAGVSGRE